MCSKNEMASSDSKEKWNEVKFTLPEDAAGKILVTFENLGGNKLARTEIPLMVSSAKKDTDVPS